MFESKYSNLLTVLLVIVIIAIVGLLGFFAWDYYQKYFITKETSDFVDNYQGDKEGEEEQETDLGDVENPLDNIESTPGGIGGTATKKYQGFDVLGTIQIPKTNCNYPILAKVSKKSIEVAVAKLYGVELNQPGNVVIIGHNYRNGLFFSNNKKLASGDKLYVTDNSGNKVTYTIYNKFETTDTDTSFYQRDTNGKAEITLSTCTDDSKARLIIFAKAD